MTITASHLTDFDIQIADGGPGVQPYSGRGLRGKLTPIALAQGDDKGAYSVNGKYIDLAAPQMRKFRLEITGNDMEAPALDNLWTGNIVNVSCLNEVSFLTTGGLTYSRTPVADSVRTQNGYTFYRPFLEMAIVGWHIETAEWEAQTSWQLTLTET
jgi:hypothetical protein